MDLLFPTADQVISSHQLDKVRRRERTDQLLEIRIAKVWPIRVSVVVKLKALWRHRCVESVEILNWVGLGAVPVDGVQVDHHLDLRAISLKTLARPRNVIGRHVHWRVLSEGSVADIGQVRTHAQLSN